MSKNNEKLDVQAVPRHVAIIMDGNGRWAESRGLTRTEGHRAGAERVKEIVYKCLELGVQYLTIYTFSKENWKRSKTEISGIMKLSGFFFRSSFRTMRKDGVFFVHLGDKSGLPRSVTKVIHNIEKNNAEEPKLHLCIAFNYSGRAEIALAFRKLSEKVGRGELKPEEIDEELISQSLYTKEIPDPDLLIRTGGEMRVSNFLLWQIAYSEFWVTGVLWPDFTGELFEKALSEYTKRERRFGGV